MSQDHQSESTIKQRKDVHVELCLNKDVEGNAHQNGLEQFQLRPKSLPELDWADIDTSRTFLGRTFSAPFLITGMTGGAERAAEINTRLAQAAAAFEIPMGVGSQRVALQDQGVMQRDFALKKRVPNLFLIANLGIGQLLQEGGITAARKAASAIEADAFAVHVNVLQELVQADGDRRFRGALQKIEELVDVIGIPVIVKEVGVGMDPQTIGRLVECGVAAVDVGGKGGTSWSRIEGMRSEDARGRQLGALFQDFGYTTAEALLHASNIAPKLTIVATGGMRSGLDAAKAVALGAHMVGFGLPLFRAASTSTEKVRETLDQFLEELKVSMLICGCATLTELRRELLK